MSTKADQASATAEDISLEKNYRTASDQGVLRLLKRNIQILKEELALGVKIDRSMLVDMETEYRQRSNNQDPTR
jgi:hypothetical protein